MGREERRMRFSERVRLAEEFDRWAEENNVEKSPLGVITFLDIKEALRKHGDCHPIRCKDCKHFTGKWCILNSRKEFDPEDRLVNGEGFCAWAERKEE